MHPSVWVGLMGISQAATGSLVAAVWQGTLLSVAAWAGLRLLPKTPAAVRFAIWFGVFVVVAGLPVVGLWPHSELHAAGSRAAWLTLDARWSLAIAAVWVLASLVRAGTLVVAAFRVRALWKRAEAVEGVEVLRPTHRDEAAMDGAPGLCGAGKLQVSPLRRFAPSVEMTSLENGKSGRRARVCVSDEVDRPSVIGFFAPKILIPRWLMEKLTADEMRQIVLHEAGHLGRADDWMNLLQKIALVVFPLNPALAWVERRLCFERELACDERVLRETGAPKAYAACLAALAEYRMGRRGVSLTLALGLGGVGRKQSELGERVGRILAGGGRMRPVQARLVMGGAILGLMVGAVELARCPAVVGFSSGQPLGTEEAVLSPHRGDRAAMNGMPGFRYRAVMFHPEEGQRRLQPTHPDNAVMNGVPKVVAGVSTHSGGAVMSGASKVAAGARSLVARTRVPEAGHGAPRAVTASTPRLPEERVEGYLVVASWSGADGSRLVMTTVKTSSEAASQDEAQQTSQDQDHRYAAVPVRGGWLVFQL